MTPGPAHPWRRVIRTVFAWMSGIAPMVPLIVDASDLSEATPGLAGALAISSAITRLLGSPQVEAFLRANLPWLAAGDVSAETVVAAVVGGKVIAGEASVVPTGEEITMPTRQARARKPARRRRVGADTGAVNVGTVLFIALIVIVVLVLVGRI